jgi:hypothetical protein
MSETNYVSKNFIKFDRKMSFMEMSGDALPIGKIRLGFRNYDKTKEKGSRILQSVDIYLDIDEAMFLSQDIISGKMVLDVRKNQKIAKDEGSYQKPAYSLLGGNTNNGKVTSRQFIIEGATELLFKAMSGPGEVLQNGLIKPSYTGKTAEQLVTISMPVKDLKRFALVLKSVCDAYYALKVNEMIEQATLNPKE